MSTQDRTLSGSWAPKHPDKLARFLQPPTQQEREALAGTDAPKAQRSGHREPGVYILRQRSDGTPLYVGTTGDLSKRLRSHARESSILSNAGVAWHEVDALLIPLPHASPALLSVIEVSLIGGIGRVADGTGTLLNRDGGGGGGHALAPAELTARALKAHQTRKMSARAKKAHETRKRNAAK
jgi:hypothetical protein